MGLQIMSPEEFDKIINGLNGFVVWKDGEPMISLPSKEVHHLFDEIDRLKDHVKSLEEEIAGEDL